MTTIGHLISSSTPMINIHFYGTHFIGTLPFVHGIDHGNQTPQSRVLGERKVFKNIITRINRRANFMSLLSTSFYYRPHVHVCIRVCYLRVLHT